MWSHILGVLGDCHWRIKGTGTVADRLGVNPSALRNRMKTLGIPRAVGELMTGRRIMMS